MPHILGTIIVSGKGRDMVFVFMLISIRSLTEHLRVRNPLGIMGWSGCIELWRSRHFWRDVWPDVRFMGITSLQYHSRVFM